MNSNFLCEWQKRDIQTVPLQTYYRYFRCKSILTQPNRSGNLEDVLKSIYYLLFGLRIELKIGDENSTLPLPSSHRKGKSWLLLLFAYLSLLALFSMSSIYQTLVGLHFLLIVLSLLPPTTSVQAAHTAMMVRAKRSAPTLAVVEAPKQEGRSSGAYDRLMVLMVVTTPPPTAPTKQTKVPTARNEGTILQDDKGKTSYATSDLKADNIAGVMDDSKSDEEGVEERTTGDGDEQGQQGKKKKRSVAKAKRWTRSKTRGPSKVKPPNRESIQSSTLTLRANGSGDDVQANPKTARAR
jgi:hypothetical protein